MAKDKNIFRENESTSDILPPCDGNPSTLPNQLSKNLTRILKETSRAFYLTLALLPAAAKRPLSLAYLLARAADTVADSEASDDVCRTTTLRTLQRSLDAPDLVWPEDLDLYHPEHVGEQRLLDSVRGLLTELASTPKDMRRAISAVVKTLIDGMLWDQELFEQDSVPNGLDDEQLERYTYLVAGCVGPFWSFVCSQDSVLSRLRGRQEKRVAIEFGKALQFVNILRDIPKDQDNGRAYLPNLKNVEFQARFREVGSRALEAFRSAQTYPLYFQPSHLRHRWALLLPLVLGLRTLEKLFASGGPRQGQRIKVSRPEVFCWLFLGPVIVTSDRLLSKTLKHLQNRAEAALKDMEPT